jgi:hypothetical protein
MNSASSLSVSSRSLGEPLHSLLVRDVHVNCGLSGENLEAKKTRGSDRGERAREQEVSDGARDE